MIIDRFKVAMGRQRIWLNWGRLKWKSHRHKRALKKIVKIQKGQPESVNEKVQTIEWQKKKVETLVDKILHRKLMIEPKQTD
jgi:hypothetical protein